MKHQGMNTEISVVYQWVISSYRNFFLEFIGPGDKNEYRPGQKRIYTSFNTN